MLCRFDLFASALLFVASFLFTVALAQAATGAEQRPNIVVVRMFGRYSILLLEITQSNDNAEHKLAFMLQGWRKVGHTSHASS